MPVPKPHKELYLCQYAATGVLFYAAYEKNCKVYTISELVTPYADVTMKTICLEATGRLTESISFPYIQSSV